jgi:hypothetical protein
LTTVTGGTLTISGGSLSGNTGAAFLVSAGSPSLSYGGTITQNTAGQRAVDMQNRTGGTVSIPGLITSSGGAGIFLSSNSGSTTTLSGGMTLSTGTIDAFTATGGGTVNVSGTNNITTTSGKGVNWSTDTSASTVTFNNVTSGTGAAVTIASSGTTNFTFNDVTSGTGIAVSVTTATGAFTFHAINANGAATGVNVSSATGSFTVNGTSAAGSGGTIQSCTGNGMKFVSSNNITLKFMNLNGNGTAQTVSGASTSCGGNLVSNNNLQCVANLFLQSVTGATLTNVSVTNSKQQGINGNAVSGLTITNGTITGNGDEAQEDGILIQDLTGTNLIQDTTIKDNFQHQVYVENGSGTSTLNVNKNTGTTLIGRTTNPASGGDHGLMVNTHGTAAMTLQVDTITIQNNGAGNGLQTNVQGSSSLNGYAQNSTFNNNAAAFNIQNNNSATINFNILNNPTMNGNAVQAINLGSASGSTGSITSKISGNHIGTQGVLGSACDVPGGQTACSGITFGRFGTNTISMTISNNLIYQVGNNGIALNTDLTGSVAFKITGNTISEPYPPSGAGVGGAAMYLNFGTSASASGQAVCLALTGNTIGESSAYPPYGWDPNNTLKDINVRARNGVVVSIANYLGGNSKPNVEAYVNANNTVVQGTQADILGGGSFANGPVSCGTPP